MATVVLELHVLDVNDPPVILTEDMTSVQEDTEYIVQYSATDIDDPEVFRWYLNTDAEWLSIGSESGLLRGTPGNDDVGTFFVNITVEDKRESRTSRNFSLQVINVNDPPIWVDLPDDAIIDEGITYTFALNAVDIDADDVITYDIDGYPASEISIDRTTGMITWNASIKGLVPDPDHVLHVNVSAWDGEERISHNFKIEVVPNPRPVTRLIGPSNNSRITWQGAFLEWEVEDDGYGEVDFDVYFGVGREMVMSHDDGAWISRDHGSTSIFSGELERGARYYWTVVPKDPFSFGTCESGVFGFSVNIPPKIGQVPAQVAIVANEIRIPLVCEDGDADPDPLIISIDNAPDGMLVIADSMELIWKPDPDQVGMHQIEVELSDGYETVSMSFEISVSEGDDDTNPIGMMIMVAAVLVLVLTGAGAGLFIFLRRQRGPKKEEE